MIDELAPFIHMGKIKKKHAPYLADVTDLNLVSTIERKLGKQKIMPERDPSTINNPVHIKLSKAEIRDYNL
jgi:hypothetical protein